MLIAPFVGHTRLHTRSTGERLWPPSSLYKSTRPRIADFTSYLQVAPYHGYLSEEEAEKRVVYRKLSAPTLQRRHAAAEQDDYDSEPELGSEDDGFDRDRGVEYEDDDANEGGNSEYEGDSTRAQSAAVEGLRVPPPSTGTLGDGDEDESEPQEWESNEQSDVQVSTVLKTPAHFPSQPTAPNAPSLEATTPQAPTSVRRGTHRKRKEASSAPETGSSGPQSCADTSIHKSKREITSQRPEPDLSHPSCYCSPSGQKPASAQTRVYTETVMLMLMLRGRLRRTVIAIWTVCAG
ncbi:hypothetical protein BDW22DRAFT_51725 [Trametopsis cervina]|nr:hypothetical protein BDW22DRAFT_51725 [Trametopsis cervina]